jgi:hypothetical protein
MRPPCPLASSVLIHVLMERVAPERAESAREWDQGRVVAPIRPAVGKITLVSDRSGLHRILAVNADGRRVLRLTDDPAEDIEPDW